MPSKSDLRKHFIKLRKVISDENQKIYAKQAAAIFADNISVTSNDIVAAYHPINCEISPLEIIYNLSNNNKTTCLPVVKKEESLLDFRKWKEGDNLNNNSLLNIKEPTGDIVTPSIIITPLVAFDLAGNRLGYGGGYYDRTFSALINNKTQYISVGLSYSSGQIDYIPTENTDIKLDYIITEKELFSFNN